MKKEPAEQLTKGMNSWKYNSTPDRTTVAMLLLLMFLGVLYVSVSYIT